MNLSELSKQEINMMVAEIVYSSAFDIFHSCLSDGVHIEFNVNGETSTFDWINDDALAFRLITEMISRGCSVEILDNCVEIIDAGDNKYESFYDMPDLGRAICETFILMNQNKEG